MKYYFFITLLVFSFFSSSCSDSVDNEDSVIDEITDEKYYKCPDNNHPHAIDFGLPSGTKWACCNVGATKPEESGGYYAWGETEEKSIYSFDNYQYGYYENDGGENTKVYKDIGEDISGTKYDVAHVKWGGKWRMPTYAQLIEFMNYTMPVYQIVKGIKGVKITNGKGGNIFIPACDYKHAFDSGVTGEGHYWISTTSNIDDRWSNHIFFNKDYFFNKECMRYFGLTIRPVYK